MENLKPVMARYLEVTKRLNELNTKAGELRDAKKSLELDLAAVYNEQELPDKIELNQSKLVFTVKKPGEWKKGWSLSKKQLEEYLNEILPEHGPDVMKEIIRKHEPKLVANDYTFELRPMATSEE
jgi:hypothetical protein